MKDDHNDDQRLYRCKQCGAIYDTHTLPRIWRDGEQVPYCRACNTHPTQIEEVENDDHVC